MTQLGEGMTFSEHTRRMNEIAAECTERIPHEPVTDEDKRKILEQLNTLTADIEAVRVRLQSPITLGELKGHEPLERIRKAGFRFGPILSAIQDRVFQPHRDWIASWRVKMKDRNAECAECAE